MVAEVNTARRRPGRKLTEQAFDGVLIVRQPRKFVRRTINLDLDVDRRIREHADAGEKTYSAMVEDALRWFVETGPGPVVANER